MRQGRDALVFTRNIQQAQFAQRPIGLEGVGKLDQALVSHWVCCKISGKQYCTTSDYYSEVQSASLLQRAWVKQVGTTEVQGNQTARGRSEPTGQGRCARIFDLVVFQF